jgi:formamidopyrimidine-DNA glycosylase
MTGRLVLVEAGAPTPRFQRALLHMDDGRALSFADQRKFGRLALAPDPESLANLLSRIGPEPGFEPSDGADPFNVEYLSKAFAGRRAPVKAILLDQRVVAGLGNIYVDEALFAAGVHPSTPGGAVERVAIGRIAEAVVSVLREAVADGGTTLADYRDANGESGTHQGRLKVFRRHGKPCLRCGSTIERSVVAQRGTHVCPECQPPLPSPR